MAGNDEAQKREIRGRGKRVSQNGGGGGVSRALLRAESPALLLPQPDSSFAAAGGC